MAAFVVSTEYVEITINDASSSGAANLSKGQAHANTVVWEARAYDNGTDGADVFGNRLIDAHVDDNAGTARINVARADTGGDMVVRCFVVEFDGSNVTVQKGTWSIGATTTTTAAPSAVTQTAAFIKFFWQCTTADTDDYEDYMFRAYFTSDTQITFEKTSASGGNNSGHWQVIEAQGGEFTVEHATGTAASLDEDATISITAVSAITDAFLVGSYDTNETSDDPRDGVWNWWLSSTTQIDLSSGRAGSASHGGTEEFNIAVVEAQNSEFSVQRVSNTAQTTAGDESEGITTVADTAFTTVHLNLSPSHSTGESSSINGNDCWPFMVAAELATSSTIEVFSGSTSDKAYSAEIIEWVESGGGPPAATATTPGLLLTGAGA